MSSIIEGYNYDIFISYRQKDNKGDRWVSEFVEALKTELESTFKEEISVYFDINPHDGLLETHDVDASLKDKLKCLIFIPIISRTYCDPKCFAWEHEFKAFVEQASRDQYGLKIKVPNGNVANRVLPVRIHDLDSDDIKLCESVLGGVLRGIEFIYKESGFNRPLKPDDDEKNNLNKTKYRNQITKVTLALKEIISGLRTGKNSSVKEITESVLPIEGDKKKEKTILRDEPQAFKKRKMISYIISVLLVLILIGAYIYPKIFKRNSLEKLRNSGERISVAVMPFQNMTNDTLWNVWQDGIQNELINKLTNSEELKVRQFGSITYLLKSKGLSNYASITPSVAGSISQKLDTDVFINGSIKQAGGTVRINAQLIESKTGESFKSFQIDGSAENILHIIDSLSVMIKNNLIINKLASVSPDYQHTISTSTNSSEAFRYFIYGEKAFNAEDFPTARRFYLQALSIDSNFFFAKTQLILATEFYNPGIVEESRKLCLEIYNKRDMMSLQQKITTNVLYSVFFETPNESIKYLKQLQELDDQSPDIHYNLGLDYFMIQEYDKAIIESEQALEIYHKWGSKPRWIHNYNVAALAYHATGQFRREKKIYKKAEEDFPGDWHISEGWARISLAEGDTAAAYRYVEKYLSFLTDAPVSKATIANEMAKIYFEEGNSGKAEEYYSKSLSLEPDNPDALCGIAYLLIDKDRNIDNGLELVEKALKVNPDNFKYLHCKGWGLYKQGKYQAALEFLQESWDLRMLNSFYVHTAYLHLQEAKKAVEGQK